MRASVSASCLLFLLCVLLVVGQGRKLGAIGHHGWGDPVAPQRAGTATVASFLEGKLATMVSQEESASAKVDWENFYKWEERVPWAEVLRAWYHGDTWKYPTGVAENFRLLTNGVPKKVVDKNRDYIMGIPGAEMKVDSGAGDEYFDQVLVLDKSLPTQQDLKAFKTTVNLFRGGEPKTEQFWAFYRVAEDHPRLTTQETWQVSPVRESDKPLEGEGEDFLNLRTFVDTASPEKQQALWKDVVVQLLALFKNAVKDQLGFTEGRWEKVWINALGQNVPYLHVRLSNWPKYYKESFELVPDMIKNEKMAAWDIYYHNTKFPFSVVEFGTTMFEYDGKQGENQAKITIGPEAKDSMKLRDPEGHEYDILKQWTCEKPDADMPVKLTFSTTDKHTVAVTVPEIPANLKGLNMDGKVVILPSEPADSKITLGPEEAASVKMHTADGVDIDILKQYSYKRDGQSSVASFSFTKQGHTSPEEPVKINEVFALPLIKELQLLNMNQVVVFEAAFTDEAKAATNDVKVSIGPAGKDFVMHVETNPAAEYKILNKFIFTTVSDNNFKLSFQTVNGKDVSIGVKVDARDDLKLLNMKQDEDSGHDPSP